MEFHGALGHVELRGDFLVGQALQNQVQHFLLAAADFHPRSQGPPRSQKLLRALGRCVQNRLTGNHHQLVIFGGLAAHQAMDGQQTGDFFHRHAAVGFRLNAETHRARGAFAQNIASWKKG